MTKYEMREVRTNWQKKEKHGIIRNEMAKVNTRWKKKDEDNTTNLVWNIAVTVSLGKNKFLWICSQKSFVLEKK